MFQQNCNFLQLQSSNTLGYFKLMNLVIKQVSSNILHFSTCLAYASKKMNIFTFVHNKHLRVVQMRHLSSDIIQQDYPIE